MLATLAALLIASPATGLWQSPEVAQEPTELRVRLLEHPANAVPLGGAFVWAFASVRSERDGPTFAIDLGSTRVDSEGAARFDLAALAELPSLDLAVCAVRVAAYRDGLFAEEWFEFDELLEPAPRGRAVFGDAPNNGERFYVGRVVDELGQPVAGVEVRRVSWDASAGLWLTKSGCCGGESDPLGYFVARSPDASEDRFAVLDPVHGRGSVAAVPEVSSATIVLTRSGAETTGRILDAAGEPVPFAEFELSEAHEEALGYDPDEPRPILGGDVEYYADYSVRADEHGEYRVLLPEHSAWWISVGEEWRVATDAPLVVHAGSADTVVPFEATRVRIHLRDESGRLLRGVVPRIYRLGSDSRALPIDGNPADPRGLGSTPSSDPDGGWSRVLEDEQPVQVAVWHELEDAWLVAAAVVVPQADRTTQATLTVRRVPRAQPLEVLFVDSNGHALSGWTARLLDATTGRSLLRFDGDGILRDTCFGPVSVGQPRPPVGTFHLLVEAGATSFALPGSASVDLNADASTNRLVRSPGFGGRLHMSAVVRRFVHGSQETARWVLTPGEDVSGVELGETRRVVACTWREEAKGGLSALGTVLLEAGTWTCALRGSNDRLIAEGGVVIAAGEVCSLDLDVER